MPFMDSRPQGSLYSWTEELWNSLTHGFGGLLAVAMLTLLVVFSALYGDAWAVVGNSIYGASLVVLYVASTLYHSMRGQRAKNVLQRFDHIAIYYLIAGTYTPLMLVAMRGTMGWVVFGIVWGLAILGTILKVHCFHKKWAEWLCVSLYLVMGWMILIAVGQIWDALSATALLFLVTGGVAYTSGVYFYLSERKYAHAIWHVFVLAGSVLQFFAVLFSCVFVS